MEGEKDEDGKLKLLHPHAISSSLFCVLLFCICFLCSDLSPSTPPSDSAPLMVSGSFCLPFVTFQFFSTSHLSPPFFPPCCSSKRCFVIRGHESVCFLLLQSLTSDSFAPTDSSLQDIRSCLARQLASFNAHHRSRNSLALTTTWSHDGKLGRILI